MAQPRVTEFFSARKRTAESQPSKRRKVVILSSSLDTLPVHQGNVRSTRASSRNKTVVDPVPDQFTFNAKAEPLAQKSIEKSKSERKSKTKSVRRVRKENTKVSENNQSSIKDAFEKVSRASSPTEDVDGTAEEVTSAWDEHDGVPLTPSKRPKNGDDSSDSEGTEATKKRTRRGKSKSAVAEMEAVVTPAKTEMVEPTRKPRQAKKKLHLRPVIDSSSEEGNSETEVSSEESSQLSLPPKTPPAISPIPETPEVVRQQLKKGPAKPTSKKVKAAMALVQKLQEGPASKGQTETKTTYKNDLKETMTSENMKQKLSKVGGLEDLKARLADMKKTKASLKKDVPKLQKFDKVDVEVPVASKEITKKAPAYERFHALATPAPPTLTMPYKYRLLGDMFRSMDTVVSMLHNRTEACTFSKLKAAVQSMTKRNFEERHVGQVKTVYPTAYTFRQQKGIPDFTSSKPAGWQLTVEANLNEDDDDIKQKKVNFSAKDLMDRRCVFQNKMLSIVKRHHKEFLAKLDKPFSVPDDKITRWHPKFPVDEIPDIEVSELPKPVVTHKYTTAKDVLEAQRGQLPVKVEQALENVALTSKESVKQENVKGEVKSVADTSSASDSQYKGIPQSLLAKIRAKENKKLTLAMTRNPAEDKRMEMLQRLPDLMRMLRSHFVTEKKPALLLENIIQKLGDSSRNFIPYSSMESHVKLMIEVLPKWLTLIEIKKGKYVKMDKNLDLQVLIEEVNKLLKNKS